MSDKILCGDIGGTYFWRNLCQVVMSELPEPYIAAVKISQLSNFKTQHAISQFTIHTMCGNNEHRTVTSSWNVGLDGAQWPTVARMKCIAPRKQLHEYDRVWRERTSHNMTTQQNAALNAALGMQH